MQQHYGSYCGITPIIRRSGTSINGRPRMSKMGNQELFDLLFISELPA
ncbi:MAG: IS110 family transposase [Chlorobi bacterium]|nr:IS110 family transposase [Chlorobiota bacterium]